MDDNFTNPDQGLFKISTEMSSLLPVVLCIGRNFERSFHLLTGFSLLSGHR